MRRQVRHGVFETNSSSVHTLTICPKREYDRWVNGELVYGRWREELCEITPEVEEDMREDMQSYLTYEQFNDWRYMDYETFERPYTSESGDKLMAFGYYGRDD